MSLKRGLIKLVLAATMVGALAGCVVEPGPGGGWCYHHPYRC